MSGKKNIVKKYIKLIPVGSSSSCSSSPKVQCFLGNACGTD
jgi:hypothetical protein